VEGYVGCEVWLGLQHSQAPVKLQSWWWRDLLKICREGGGNGWFLNEIGWILGRGDKVKFWEDVWVGNSNLKKMFPRLFSLSLNQGNKVEEVGRVGRFGLAIVFKVEASKI